MANYLNRPSIFEIATAFEDGQEGEIKQKDKGPYETYRDLSDDEKSSAIQRTQSRKSVSGHTTANAMHHQTGG